MDLPDKEKNLQKLTQDREQITPEIITKEDDQTSTSQSETDQRNKKEHLIVMEENVGSSRESEDEEVEPKLIYERITNDCAKIFRKDSISCSLVHEKFLIFGTVMGKIFIFDHQGNAILNPLCLHETKINDLSMENKGEYIISCSVKKVVLHGLYSDEPNLTVSLNRPTNCVAIDPNFSRGTIHRRFITGDNKVVLHEKSLLSGYKTTILFDGDREIHTIKWRDNFVAWAGKNALRIYDMEERAIITYIRRDTEIVNCRCCLNWASDRELLVGWGCTVKSCRIGQRNASELIDRKTPKKYVYIPYIHELDRVICGIAPFTNPTNLLLLTLGLNLQEEDDKLPNVQVLELGEDELLQSVNLNPSTSSAPETTVTEDPLQDKQVLSDIVALKGYQTCTYLDYCLQNLIEDRLYYIIAPNDVIIGKPRDPDDHINWLLDKKRFEQALADARLNASQLYKHSPLSVGRLYIKYLVDSKNELAIQKAAKLCPEVLGDSKIGWEETVFMFLKCQSLHLLEPYLPVQQSGILSPHVAELILNYFLQRDTSRFARLVQKWPSDAYSVQQILGTLKTALLTAPNDRHLSEAMATLHVHNGQYEQALIDYISLGDRVRTFDLIRDRHLVSCLRDKLDVLMNLDPNQTAELLIEHREQISIEYVVRKLQKDSKNTGTTPLLVKRPNLNIEQPEFLLPYLDRIVQIDPELAVEWHQILVELYAEHAPHKLMRFLKTSSHYSLEQALKVCRSAKRMPEAVFLLSRMGNAEQALHCILTELNDFEQAIEFCREHGDAELWQQLSKYTLDKPEMIRTLLETVGASLPNPIEYIENIPSNLKIPGLKSALEKLLQDSRARISLERSCLRIMMADCHDLDVKLNKSQKRGIVVTDQSVCSTCSHPLLTTSAQSDMITFRCGHVFHEACVMFGPTDKCICPVCIDPRRMA